MKMVTTFDILSGSYTRTVPRNRNQAEYPPEDPDHFYIGVHLVHVMTRLGLFRLRTRVKGRRHGCMRRFGALRNQSLVNLPPTIMAAVRALYEDAVENDPDSVGALWNPGTNRVEATWIMCYLYSNLPDQSVQGWENFDCSHRCISKSSLFVCSRLVLTFLNRHDEGNCQVEWHQDEGSSCQVECHHKS